MPFMRGQRVRQIGDTTGPFWTIATINNPDLVQLVAPPDKPPPGQGGGGPPGQGGGGGQGKDKDYTCTRQYYLKPSEVITETQNFFDHQLQLA